MQESQHSTDLVERDHDVEAGLGGDGMGVLQHWVHEVLWTKNLAKMQKKKQKTIVQSDLCGLHCL